MNQLIIHADKGSTKISRHLYGHFAEHLGTGIYEGLWVWEDSPIPNTRGIRNDVVAAFRQITGRTLAAPTLDAHNTFAQPDAVTPRMFTDFRFSNEMPALTLPARAVAVLSIET